MARSPRELDEVAPAFRRAVWNVDSKLAVPSVDSMEAYVATAVARERFSAQLFSIFAGIALVIALQGIYGVLSYVVAQRRGEIGVRLALGARPAQVLHLILGRGIWLTGAGLGAGLIAALGLTRFPGFPFIRDLATGRRDLPGNGWDPGALRTAGLLPAGPSCRVG